MNNIRIILSNIYYGITANDFYYFSTVTWYSNGIVKTSLTSPTVIKSYGNRGAYRGKVKFWSKMAIGAIRAKLFFQLFS